MADDRKYVRVYYNDLIRDYPDVWSDNDALATWLRMLATADPMWPTPPELPRSVKARPLASLTGCGLVARVGQDRFSLKGLDAERIKRQDAARNAAALRWHGKGIPPPDAPAMPKRAEPSKDEPSQADAGEGTDILDAYYRLTTRFPTANTAEWLEKIANEFGVDATARMLATVHLADPAPKTLISRLENELRSESHRQEKAALAREKAELEAYAKSRQITPEQAEANRVRLDEITREMFEESA